MPCAKSVIMNQICEIRCEDPESEESKQFVKDHTFAELYSILKEAREFQPLIKKISRFY